MEHAAALREYLALHNADWTTPPAGLIVLDAHETLDLVAPAGVVNHAQIAAALTPLVSDGPCRLFGEMVSILAARRQVEAAIDLEMAGEELAHRLGVAVLCAYDLNQLDLTHRGNTLLAIDALHDHSNVEITAPTLPPTRD